MSQSAEATLHAEIKRLKEVVECQFAELLEPGRILGQRSFDRFGTFARDRDVRLVERVER